MSASLILSACLGLMEIDTCLEFMNWHSQSVFHNDLWGITVCRLGDPSMTVLTSFLARYIAWPLPTCFSPGTLSWKTAWFLRDVWMLYFVLLKEIYSYLNLIITTVRLINTSCSAKDLCEVTSVPVTTVVLYAHHLQLLLFSPYVIFI